VVAEDHQDMLRVMVSLLSKKFDIVATVKDGNALLDAAVSLLPDVIVSDISMPKLTGLQAMRELSARGCWIPFVFVTSEPALIVQDTLSFVDKLDAYDELVPAIEAVAVGKRYVSPRARCRTRRF
jgi:CheY-like chemotaxis protein